MKLKEGYLEFQDEIKKRGIKYLVHFTRFESISAIVGEGKILPRDRLHNLSYDWRELVAVNAQERRDDPGFLNASIMHPNTYLMGIFRDRWYPGSRFCVIGINPIYIFEPSTRFSVTNATYQTAKESGINGDLQAFRSMFGPEISGRPNRATGGRYTTKRSTNTPSCFPTDPEAEILIRSEIPYNDIYFIACRDQYDHDLLASAFHIMRLPTEKLRIEPTFFEPRK